MKVAEDEHFEKRQFSLAVKIKRQSSQSAQLSASFLYGKTQILVNNNAKKFY